ncbi:hypothetical protein Tco_0490623 [Tanacetum coccineum]
MVLAMVARGSDETKMMVVVAWAAVVTMRWLVPSCFVIFDLDPLSLSFDFFEHEHVVMNPTPAGMRHHHLHRYVDSKNLLDRFPAQSIGTSNTDVLDLPCLLVLITGTSQSRQHGFPFVIVNTKEYHSECSRRITGIMRGTLVNSL